MAWVENEAAKAQQGQVAREMDFDFPGTKARSIEGRQDRISKGLALLEEALDRLCDKLNPVLGAPGESVPQDKPVVPEEERSSHAQFLAYVATQVAKAGHRVDQITDGIDL